MFLFCPFKDNECPFCGEDAGGALRCGLAAGENRIAKMKRCPLEIKKKTKGGVFNAQTSSKIRSKIRA